jgi:hypothetical protein
MRLYLVQHGDAVSEDVHRAAAERGRASGVAAMARFLAAGMLGPAITRLPRRSV